MKSGNLKTIGTREKKDPTQGRGGGQASRKIPSGDEVSPIPGRRQVNYNKSVSESFLDSGSLGR